MAMIWRGFYFYRRRMDRRRVLRALAFLLMAMALTVRVTVLDNRVVAMLSSRGRIWVEIGRAHV